MSTQTGGPGRGSEQKSMVLRTCLLPCTMIGTFFALQMFRLTLQERSSFIRSKQLGRAIVLGNSDCHYKRLLVTLVFCDCMILGATS